jgi:hypothetical protein
MYVTAPDVFEPASTQGMTHSRLSAWPSVDLVYTKRPLLCVWHPVITTTTNRLLCVCPTALLIHPKRPLFEANVVKAYHLSPYTSYVLKVPLKT